MWATSRLEAQLYRAEQQRLREEYPTYGGVRRRWPRGEPQPGDAPTLSPDRLRTVTKMLIETGAVAAARPGSHLWPLAQMLAHRDEESSGELTPTYENRSTGT